MVLDTNYNPEEHKLLSIELEDGNCEIQGHKSNDKHFSNAKSWKYRGILILSLLLSNVCTALVVSLMTSQSHSCRQYHSQSVQHGVKSSSFQMFPIVEDLPTTYTRFKWWTAWSRNSSFENGAAALPASNPDELWAGIRADHGIVAVDRQWAKDRHWPESMYLPLDKHGKEKGVYVLKGYHLLHCLSALRNSYFRSPGADERTGPDKDHANHCFDTLRQEIQCTADNTPLYTFGDNTIGDGQLHECKSWDALRNWATEHSACYRDAAQDTPLQDHFGFCTDGRPYQAGKDGLP